MVVLPAGTPGTTDPTFDPSQGGERIGSKAITAGSFAGGPGRWQSDCRRRTSSAPAACRAGISCASTWMAPPIRHFRVSIGGNREVTCFAIQPDGRILIGGDFTEVNGQPRLCLRPLDPDGSLDASFTPLLSGAPQVICQAILPQPDGKILLGGNFTMVNGQPRHHVARLIQTVISIFPLFPRPGRQATSRGSVASPCNRTGRSCLDT